MYPIQFRMAESTCIKYFKKFQLALDEINDSLLYLAPELKSENFRRNPVVIMHDMAKKVPEGIYLDHFVAGFSELALDAANTDLSRIVSSWWMPVSDYGLFEVIGVCDCNWKTEAIAVWMDPNYTKKTFN